MYRKTGGCSMKANHNKIPPVISFVNASTTFIDILGTTYVNYTLSLSPLSLSLSIYMYVYVCVCVYICLNKYRYKCICMIKRV